MQQGPVSTLQKSDMGLIFRGINKTVDDVPTGSKMQLIIQVGRISCDACTKGI